MANFYNSLKGLISHEMISKASLALDEQQTDISKAVSSIIPGFLGVLLKNGITPQIRNIFEEAGNLNILSDSQPVDGVEMTQDQQNIGDNFLQHILGDKAADFTDSIATYSGISKVSANNLISRLAPVVAGFLGNKLTKENFSLHGILKEIEKEKDSFSYLIPSGIVNSFGLLPIVKGNHATKEEEPEKKSGNSWVKWIILLVVLLLAFLGWRACQNEKTGVTTAGETVPQVSAESIQAELPEEKVSTELTLSNGVKLQAYSGGVEDEIIKYLESDHYKKATENELKEKWFKFDNIEFEYGSSTNLKPESKIQLDNIVAILKNYKDAKILIGGFADKKGTEQANLKVSKERAKTVETLLEKGGIGSQIVKAEGYGDEYAKHSASESNEQRAEDRDISLRFVK